MQSLAELTFLDLEPEFLTDLEKRCSTELMRPVSSYNMKFTKKDGSIDKAGMMMMKSILDSCNAVGRSQHKSVLKKGQNVFFRKWEIVMTDYCRPTHFHDDMAELQITRAELEQLVTHQNTVYRFKITMVIFSWVMRLVAEGRLNQIEDVKNKGHRMKFWRTTLGLSGEYYPGSSQG